MLAYPSILLFAAMVAGILSADALCPSLRACAALTGCAALALFGAGRRRRGGVLAACLLVFTAAAWKTRQVAYPPDLPASCAPEGGLWQIAIVAPIDRQMRGSQMRLQTTASLVAERCGNVWRPRTGTVRLALRPGLDVARGDRLALRLQLLAPPKHHHAFEPHPTERLRRKGLTAHARVLSDATPLRAGTGLYAGIDHLRTRAAVAMEAGLPAQTAALAKALALGDTAALTPEQREAWGSAGIAHLLSVSGLHVGIVAMLVAAAARFGLSRLPGAGCRWSLRGPAAMCALPPVVGFCILTGAHAAALRATIMAVGALAGIVLRTPAGTANAWGLAGAFMLMADPMALYDVGFILSFVAVAALIWLGRPPARDPLEGLDYDPFAPPPKARDKPVWRQRGERMAMGIAASWRVSLAATLVTAPVTALVFNRFCWVAPLVNLIAVPVGSLLATPCALLAAAVAPRAGWPQALLMRPLDAVLRALDALAHAIGERPWANWDVPGPRWYEVIFYAVLLLAWHFRKRSRHRAMAWGLASGLALVACVAARIHGRTGDGNLWVRHLYVGQGDATLVTLPAGGTVLIDGGGAIRDDLGPDPGRTGVAPTLRRLNIHRIDRMVLTHPHPDHINGLYYIAGKWPVGTLILGGGGADYSSVRRLADLVQSRGGRVVRLADLPKRQFWEGVQVDLLHPRNETADVYPRWNLNDNSVVMRLQWGDRSVLLTGDIEKRAEAVLAQRGIRADIFKVGHHGSRTSTTLGFLEALQAHTAVISCGEGNRFNFPHPETLERLGIRGVRILRTDAEGTITFRTDGRRWHVATVGHPSEVLL